MTEPGPPTDPFAPPSSDWVPLATPPAPPPPPVWGPPPPGGPPPPAWAHPQLQQQNPWQQGGWQQPQPWYGGWQAPKRTNGLAIAALVTGVLALVPVSVGLAVAALSRIRRRDEAGVGLAVGGIAASGLWTLLVGLVALAGLSGAFDFGYDREGDLADVASREVGICFNQDPLVVTDCASPHDREVYYSAPLPTDSWPGEHEVDLDADDVCYSAFEDYVGLSYEDSDYDYTFYAPAESEWRAGDRTVVCVVTPADSYLVGTVKGSAR